MEAALSLFCRWCERVFQNRVSRNTHEKRFHLKEREAYAQPKTEIDPRNFNKCDVCSIYTSRDVYDIAAHKTSEHHLRRLQTKQTKCNRQQTTAPPLLPLDEVESAYPRLYSIEPPHPPELVLVGASANAAAEAAAESAATAADSASASAAAAAALAATTAAAAATPTLPTPEAAQHFRHGDEEDSNYVFFAGKDFLSCYILLPERLIHALPRHLLRWGNSVPSFYSRVACQR